MDEVLRKMLERQTKLMPMVKEQATEVKFIPLKKNNLECVEIGMYWYADDTVSKVFSPRKSLKSLVLIVDKKEGIVYGDSFRQRYIIGDQISAYMDALQAEYAKQFPFGIIYRPTSEELQQVFKNISVILPALKAVKQLQWSEDLFWGEPKDKYHSAVVDMLDGDSLNMSGSSGAYFRPMIAFMAP